MLFFGEIAALTTALCWTFTSLFFTEAGRIVGSWRVNNIRLLFATTIYAVILVTTTGQIWPEMNMQQLLILVISGLIGLVIGDGFGFKALVMIGPRITTLLWATAPIMVTLIAWFFMGETLHALDLIGIAMTLSGIAWVVAERKYENNNLKKEHPDSGTLFKGVIFGLLAALGQGVGLVLSKQAMLYEGDRIDALPASFVRMFSAMILIWLFSAFTGKFVSTVRAMREGKAMAMAAGGSLFGPFLGVWMSMVAVARIEAGIAATLNAMTPILIIPVVRFYYKEKVSMRAMLGAMVAVSGVAVLLLGDMIIEWFSGV